MPFHKLNKNEFLQELETTSKYIKERLADSKFTKFIKSQFPQSSLTTSRCKYLNVEEVESYLNKPTKNPSINTGNTQTNILHLNIRSLDKHFGELMALDTQTNHIFDYIALCEIGKKNIDSRKALLKSMGFNFQYKLSHLCKGGVGLIVKEDLEIKVRSDLVFKNTKFNKVNLITESLWIEREFDNKNLNFIIGVIYRHPGSTKECLEDFTQQLNNIIKKVERENKKVYIVGDLNIDGMKVTENKQVGNFFNMLLDNNYLPTITKPTRIQDTSISLLDHTIVNASTVKNDSKIISGILYSGITDHLPVFISIQESHRIIPKERPLIRIYCEKNINSFQSKLAESNWDKFEESNNCTEALKIFYDIWNKCHNEAFPLTRLSRAKCKQKPWISADLKKEIIIKNKLYRETIRNPTPSNKVRLKEAKNKVTNHIRSAHGKYYQNKINGEKQNLKTMWNLFGKVINSKKMKDQNNIRELKLGKKIITKNAEIADALNSFFCNIGQDLSKNHSSDYKEYSKYLGPRLNIDIELKPTSNIEIFDIIGTLKNKRSGIDEVHPILLKRCRILISNRLKHIFNLSIEQKSYPDTLKIAKCIPLFKKSLEEERLDPGNYRPISLLSSVNKIYEKILYKRLIRFIDQNDLLYKYQFGFRRIHSTTLALMDVIDNIRTNLNNRKKVAGVYIDFSKAFDTVNHTILARKLEHYGIRGDMLTLLASYLKNRKQYTIVNGTKSSTMEINCGVPQGSVLGPLLFLLYANDIQNCTKEVLKLFADDANGFVFADDYKTLKSKIENVLSNLFKWSTANKLTISISKTCYSIFHNANCRVPAYLNSVRVKNAADNKVVSIKRENHSKYLGIYLDESLNWNYHLNDPENGLIPKLTKINNSLKIVRYYIPERNRMLMYNAYVSSRISYGIELIGSANKTFLHKLQVKQNRALKILFFKDYETPTLHLHHELKVLMVADAYKFSLAKFVFKQLNNKLPFIFRNLYTKVNETHTHETRQSNLIKIENKPNKTPHSEKLLSVTGALAWNELPVEVRAAKTLKTFSMLAKQHYIGRYQGNGNE